MLTEHVQLFHTKSIDLPARNTVSKMSLSPFRKTSFSPPQKQFEVSLFRRRRIDNKKQSFHWFITVFHVVGTKGNQCYLLEDSSNALHSWFSDGGSNLVSALVSEKTGHEWSQINTYLIHPPTVLQNEVRYTPAYRRLALIN